MYVLVVGPAYVGLFDGLSPLGLDVGFENELGVGLRVRGAVVGESVGLTVGDFVGLWVGLSVVGDPEGSSVGDNEMVGV